MVRTGETLVGRMPALQEPLPLAHACTMTKWQQLESGQTFRIASIQGLLACHENCKCGNPISRASSDQKTCGVSKELHSVAMCELSMFCTDTHSLKHPPKIGSLWPQELAANSPTASNGAHLAQITSSQQLQLVVHDLCPFPTSLCDFPMLW